MKAEAGRPFRDATRRVTRGASRGVSRAALPGVVWGDYPERMPRDEPGAHGWLDASWNWLRALAPQRRAAPYAQFAMQVEQRMAPLIADRALWVARLEALRPACRRSPEDEATVLEAGAVVAAALHHSLGLVPYRSQIIAARVMLDGSLAEMATGEGKTVALAMAAAMCSLGGSPVHLVTANDYLAARDAEMLGAFYGALGLRIGVVTQPMDQAARREAWRCSITYCTAKELAFDYLRDGLLRPRDRSELSHRARRVAPAGPVAEPLLRGLCMAIIDEVDTVLIDEARVPLVLSQGGDTAAEADFLASALACARTLVAGPHFTLVAGQAKAVLREKGRERVRQWPFAVPAAGRTTSRPVALHANQRHREDSVATALAALHLYQRDRDYVVQGGKLLIVDETTGRTAPGRAWSRGLHQLIELREGVQATARSTTVTQITYQRFFRRYLRLSGMSGTVGGSAREMSAVYGVSTVRVPPRLPRRREELPLRLFASDAALWLAVSKRVSELHPAGRPVLVGTGSVAQSDALSAVLLAAGLPHAVLNARQDHTEGPVVAQAGQPGRITVATSMAGRGTDIALGEGVVGQGGLYVILCQHNGSRRIDRQFSGRCARQGQPGTVETLLSLESPLFIRWLPGWLRELAPRAPHVIRRLLAALPQWLEEAAQRGQRQMLCRMDEQAERELSFGQKHPT